ncbi:MAG: hypothetical protein HC799_02300 [Limnothrix sp. RL_2_0]|nr:hypothetical protein [Limnothrix sp. RL_2_0]
MADVSVPNPYQLLLGGVAAIALLTVGLIVGVSQKVGRNVLNPRYFFCEQSPYPVPEQFIWTLIYRSPNQEVQPWFKLMPGVEGGNDLGQRCAQMANVLDGYYNDQLQTLLYRVHPASPNRYSLCVRTEKHGPENCATLLILQPNTSPKPYFAEFTEPLAAYRSGQPLTVDLKKLLVTEAP